MHSQSATIFTFSTIPFSFRPVTPLCLQPMSRPVASLACNGLHGASFVSHMSHSLELQKVMLEWPTCPVSCWHLRHLGTRDASAASKALSNLPGARTNTDKRASQELGLGRMVNLAEAKAPRMQHPLLSMAALCPQGRRTDVSSTRTVKKGATAAWLTWAGVRDMTKLAKLALKISPAGDESQEDRGHMPKSKSN